MSKVTGLLSPLSRIRQRRCISNHPEDRQINSKSYEARHNHHNLQHHLIYQHLLQSITNSSLLSKSSKALTSFKLNMDVRSSSFLFRQVFADYEVFTRCLHLPLSLIVSRVVLKSIFYHENISFSARSCLTL